MSPASHPIRADVPDVAHAFANFDQITYAKGQAVLRQLVAYVGEDGVRRGLARLLPRPRVAQHGARRPDRRDHRRLRSRPHRVDRGLARPGRHGHDRPASRLGRSVRRAQLLTTSADGGEPRPHRLRIGSYRGSGTATPPTRLSSTSRPRMSRPPGPITAVDLPDADVHLLNDGDLTFAAVRTDEESLEAMLDLARRNCPTRSRAPAWSPPAGTCSSRASCRPASSSTACWPFSRPSAAQAWWSRSSVWRCGPPSSGARRPWSRDVCHALADVAARRADETEYRTAALRTLAASAATGREHFELLDREASQDVDLAWLTLIRRASLGVRRRRRPGAARAATPTRSRRPGPLAVGAARPDARGQGGGLGPLFDDRAVPAGPPLGEVAQAFWRPVQHDLLVPYADRYLETVTSLDGEGMMATLSLVGTMAPTTCADDWPDRARKAAERDDANPLIRNTLLTTADTLSRVLRARS